MFDAWSRWVSGLGLDPRWSAAVDLGGSFLVILILSVLAKLVARRVLLATVTRLVRASETELDDIFLERKLFSRLAHLAPALVIYLLGPAAFHGHPTVVGVAERGSLVYMLAVAVFAIDAFLNALVDVYRRSEMSKQRDIKGYVQIVKIFLYIGMGIVILSMILDRSPVVMLSGFGALTAVILLVFKDAILGFVAGIQISANDMVRPGDWIEMARYGADGPVMEITLTTVKVRNWDKTITTIPTYSLVSDSFRNWRGMTESGGRRIKRSLNVDMSSIRFLSPEEIERFKRVELLKDYVTSKEKELAEWNEAEGLDLEDPINGRRLTNVGTFRAYIVSYLKRHPMIHQDMTFLVRHLPPGEHGLPIEIYVFSKDQVWANYEAIQADIFDHILAVAPEFGLKVFQRPSGHDMRAFSAKAST